MKLHIVKRGGKPMGQQPRGSYVDSLSRLNEWALSITEQFSDLTQ